ncbi:MAG TPA: hypothetical protein PKA41_03770 [Verrucomicrobiota bacterium]|nr:hypothetical protein [Verrucomicrobiota bacterium]
MKIHLKSYCLLGALLLGMSAGALHAQILPIDCGAVSTNAGSKLKFINGDSFSSGSGFVQPMVYQRIANRYGTNNHYTSSNLLFRALSVQTNSESSAAVGSYIVCQVMSVSGPAGAKLYFWEQGNGRPTYVFPVGGIFPTGKNRFILGNCETGAGLPDGDPFGSIRGRRFSVDKAGDYTVTFKLYDVSDNHPTLTSTPIHAPSDPLTIKFSTAVDMDITQFVVTNEVAALVYKQGLLTNMYVESSTNLTTWTPVAGPFASAPPLTTNLFAVDPSLPSVYFRLRGETP